MTAQPLLDVSDLTVEFATRRGIVKAVQHVNISVAKGETLGIVGESGSGKSVTSYAVMRILDRAGKIAEGSVMQQGTQAIYTMPNSKIKTLAGLKGHVLGINAPLNINYLLAASVLTENGVKLSSVHFPTQPIPFPMMAAEMAAGKVAAAAMPEPFATAAEQHSHQEASTNAVRNQRIVENPRSVCI